MFCVEHSPWHLAFFLCCKILIGWHFVPLLSLIPCWKLIMGVRIIIYIEILLVIHAIDYICHNDYLNAFPHTKCPESFGWFAWWNDRKSLLCLVFNFLSYAMSVNQFTSPLSGHSSDYLLMFAPRLFWQGNLVCFFGATEKTIFMYVLGVCDICVCFAVLQHFQE